MNLDGNIFVFEINVSDAGFLHKFCQLLLKIGACAGTQVGKIYF